ncbi:MAG: Gfo/Idh/MocA family oxidoreductase [Gemmataceae bacterium]|nr:Gfo/Idh/MocA family oxidoreductase [Gemmataceae bacterium]
MQRREFLKASAGTLAAGAMGGVAYAAPQNQNNGGANERLNIACIGVNGQGMGHVRGYAGRLNCVVTHICDVDTRAAGRAVAAAQKQQDSEPRVVQDIRRLLDDKSIHAVSIATPNHWHALATIWAIQAGKDVYVEKPVSHNVSEGRRMVEFARRHNKIVQTGTQIRSQPGIREAIEFIRSGKIGKVQVARGLCYKRRDNAQGRVDNVNAANAPKDLDFNLWLGPAPQRAYHENLVHYRWHWYWDFGNGDLGNQGIHQMDVARWALGKNELARSAISLGGRFGYVDRGETPNTQICVFDYGDAELIIEVRGLATKNYRGAGVGNVIHCADGYVVFPSYTEAVAYSNDGQVLRRFNGSANHFENFIRAVRSRRREDLHADIEEGHLSSSLCHLANISYRLGRPTPFNQQSKTFGDDRAAAETLERMSDHLRECMLPLDKTNYMLGRRLTIDPKTESFVNDADANRQLTREYRKGFEVPARV